MRNKRDFNQSENSKASRSSARAIRDQDPGCFLYRRRESIPGQKKCTSEGRELRQLLGILQVHLLACLLVKIIFFDYFTHKF